MSVPTIPTRTATLRSGRQLHELRYLNLITTKLNHIWRFIQASHGKWTECQFGPLNIRHKPVKAPQQRVPDI